jgi:hypothetical protein
MRRGAFKPLLVESAPEATSWKRCGITSWPAGGSGGQQVWRQRQAAGGSRSGGSGGGSRLRLDLHLGLFAHDDDHVRTEAAGDTFREGDFTDVDAFADFKVGDVDLDAFRQIFRQAAHFDLVMDGLDQTALLQTLGDATMATGTLA